LARVIKSTAAIRESFERKTRDHLIYGDAIERARAKNYSPETIAKMEREALDRVRNARVRLELQGAPLRYKPALPSGNPNDPTPERLAKAGKQVQKIAAGGGKAAEGDVAPRKAHKIRSVIDQYSSLLLLDRRSALERFLQDGIYAQYVRTANPEPSSVRGDGTAIGGLGDVEEYVRIGFARYSWVHKHLGEEARQAARALVTHEDILGNGSSFSFEEFGKRLAPTEKNANRHWGAAFGALKVLSGQLMRLYELCPHAFFPVSEHERECAQELGRDHEN